MKKRIVAILLALAMLLSTVALAETAAYPVEGEGSLTFVATEPNTLNMVQASSNLDSAVFYLTSAMLYRPYNGNVYPELAAKCDVSEDKLTYTYTLKDAVYSDGTPIVAADFAYYMIATMDGTSAAYYKNGTKYMNGECTAADVGIYAKDEKTLVVELEMLTADFSPELEIYPLQQAFVEAKGEQLGGTPADLMYSGPYVLTEWVYGSYMTFKKNPSYVDAAASFPLAELRLIHSVDESGRYSMFTSGEADVLTFISEETQQMIPNQAKQYVSDAMQGLEFNTTGMMFDAAQGTFLPRDAEVTKVLSNENFRKALSYAINRELLVMVINPSGLPVNRLVTPMAEGNTDGSRFVEDYPLTADYAAPITGDAEAAKAYLAKALEELGYASVKDLPTIKYLCFENGAFRLMAETLQSEWKSILGLECIEIEMKPVQDAVMSMVFLNYDIYFQSVSSSSATPRSFLEQWKTGGAISDAMQSGAPFGSVYSNAEFDALVEQAMFEFDTAKRQALIAQAEQIMIEEHIFVPILLQGGYYAVQDYVQGFVSVGNQEGYMFNHTTVTK
ncbi:MAG: peptide ABC transporter substrate-binding protein [Clostridia bacterium]|nr:peptide ABC transporter substrate-binding protein [Clostridia bacterium]